MGFGVLSLLFSAAFHRVALTGLLAVSFLASVAPAFVNCHLASTETPLATDQFATMPRQQIAVWHGLLLGLRGRPLPMPPEIAADPIRSASARFPDLWTVRIMERSRAGLVLGLALSLLLLLPALWNFRRLMELNASGIRRETDVDSMAASR